MNNGGMEVFLEALATGDTGAAIMNQEAREQQKAVSKQQLPCDGTIRPGPLRDDGQREKLESLGFVFHTEGIGEDDLFVLVTFPEGWHIAATGHSMHNDLVDDQGRKRGSYFYKGAFYDRHAQFYGLSSRYRIADVYGDFDTEYDGQKRVTVQDMATETELYDSGWLARHDWGARDEASHRARAWLDEHYPDHQNPLAYW